MTKLYDSRQLILSLLFTNELPLEDHIYPNQCLISIYNDGLCVNAFLRNLYECWL